MFSGRGDLRTLCEVGLDALGGPYQTDPFNRTFCPYNLTFSLDEVDFSWAYFYDILWIVSSKAIPMKDG